MPLDPAKMASNLAEPRLGFQNEPAAEAPTAPPAGFVALADVEALIAEKLAAATEKLVAGLAPRAAPADAGFAGLAEGLAMAIAELNDQGSGRKRISPAEVRKQAAGHERMTALIEQAARDGERPIYTLTDKVHLDETLIEPMWKAGPNEIRRTRIEWPHPPNRAMRPFNPVAEGIYAAFLESIGGVMPKPPDLRISGTGVVYADGRTASRKPLPQVVEPEGGGVKVLDRGGIGDRMPRHVLGTIAAPAMETRLQAVE
jgi:hypothetical protein